MALDASATLRLAASRTDAELRVKLEQIVQGQHEVLFEITAPNRGPPSADELLADPTLAKIPSSNGSGLNRLRNSKLDRVLAASKASPAQVVLSPYLVSHSVGNFL